MVFERIYDLYPMNGRQSFYGKAKVYIEKDGTETLYSYNTPVARRNPDGTVVRLWSGWSMTTGNHIYSFCGMHKKEWDKVPMAE